MTPLTIVPKLDVREDDGSCFVTGSKPMGDAFGFQSNKETFRNRIVGAGVTGLEPSPTAQYLRGNRSSITSFFPKTHARRLISCARVASFRRWPEFTGSFRYRLSYGTRLATAPTSGTAFDLQFHFGIEQHGFHDFRAGLSFRVAITKRRREHIAEIVVGRVDDGMFG